MGRQSKICAKCGKEKSITRFSIGASFVRNSVCKDCQSSYVLERYHRTAPWYEDWIYRD